MDSDDRERELAAAVRKLSKAAEGSEKGVAELRDVVDLLVEILIGKEVLSPGHKRLIEKLRERAGRAPRSKVRLRSLVDKYEVANADIDCARYRHLCHSRCCSFSITLTIQDVEDGEIRWEIEEPYMLRHDEDGYCVHHDRETGGCGIYERRPATCREYECSQDRRVWIDFAEQQPAPMPAGLLPPHRRGPSS